MDLLRRGRPRPGHLKVGRPSRPGPFVLPSRLTKALVLCFPPRPPDKTIMSSSNNYHFGHSSPLFGAAGSPAGDKAVEASIESLPHYTGEPHFEKLDTPGHRAEIKRWCLPPERVDGRGPLSSVVAVTRQHGGRVNPPEYIVYERRQCLPTLRRAPGHIDQSYKYSPKA